MQKFHTKFETPVCRQPVSNLLSSLMPKHKKESDQIKKNVN